MQLGIAAYLRNIAVRSNRIAVNCADDPKIRHELEKISAELTDKAEAIEQLFEIPSKLK